jgi:hypothetical protein
MSSLGEARSFLLENGDFSLPRFLAWTEIQVLAPMAPRADTIAGWLPASLLSASACVADRVEFVRDVTRAFLAELMRLHIDLLQPAGESGVDATAHDAIGANGAGAGGRVADSDPGEGAQRQQVGGTGQEEDEPEMLLDLLFDQGLLPSYAFPTDLATFVIFGWDNELRRKRVKERPQQGKDKALSEYAPGRLLVVDKQTYRVGGVYVDDPRVLNPGEVLFAHSLPVYVSCPQCTYVELRRDRGLTPQICPVCQATLTERLMLDPPAFAPENAEPLGERDKTQEISFATEAQIPTPIRAAAFPWQLGPSLQFRIAYQENQELVIANHGPRHEGFRVCQSCGASWPDRDTPPNRRHTRPYPITAMHRQAGIGRDCSGPLTEESLVLGHKFRTDILLLQVALCRPLSYGPRDPWLHEGLRSAAEAMSLAASRILSIDPGELAAGYRLMPPTVPTPGAIAAVELYLYDTAAGGAGYAAEAGERLPEILETSQALLDGCPNRCERSCTQCLRHYGNRFWHERMDRSLASQLVHYMRTGTPPSVAPLLTQTDALRALARYLELEGGTITLGASIHGLLVPLLVQAPGGPVVVGTHPALLELQAAEQQHPLQQEALALKARLLLVNDYVLSRDLPTAYQRFRSMTSD